MELLDRAADALPGEPSFDVVVGNLTKSEDGKWRSLDGRSLYQHAKTGGYVYQAEIRARLTEYIGVEWHEVHNGMADIAGMDRSVIDHFSQRRAEIVEALGGAQVGLCPVGAGGGAFDPPREGLFDRRWAPARGVARAGLRARPRPSRDRTAGRPLWGAPAAGRGGVARARHRDRWPPGASRARPRVLTVGR